MKILARGGETLTIAGGIFHPARAYACIFTGATIQMSTGATAASPHRVTCRSPALSTAAETVTLSLMEDGHMIPFIGAAGNEVLTYVPSLESVTILVNESAIAPRRLLSIANIAPASGSVTVLIDGYGFETPSADYFCQLSANTNEMTSVATALSSRRLTCVLPPWGSQYAASTVRLQILQSVFGTSEKRAIEFMVDGYSSFPCIASGPCMINLIPVLEELEGPSSGRAEGGCLFTLKGAGFRTDEAYSCFFGHDSETVTSSARVVTPSMLQCNAPPWPYGAATVSLNVLDSRGSEILPIRSKFVFTYESTWRSKDVSAGPAKGGSIMTIHGAGFRQGSSVEYRCMFSYESESVVSYAESLSTSSIICVVPKWPFAAADTTFTVSGDSQLQYSGVYVGRASLHGRFMFREGWDNSAGRLLLYTWSPHQYAKCGHNPGIRFH